MKRQVRRMSRKLGRKFDDARSYATTLLRSNSDYHYPTRTSNVTSTVLIISLKKFFLCIRCFLAFSGYIGY
jgi:hypothetical protein